MNTADAAGRRLRVGVVGAGGITHAHVPAWLELGAECAAFSRSGVAPLVEQYGVRSCDTFDELLRACDIVDICSPTTTHLGYIEAALRAGRDVICEKPLVRTASDGARIAALMDATERHVYPAHVVRWFPEYAAAKAAVEDGRIGVPLQVELSRIGEFPSWAPWFADDEQSGGVVLDLMIHDLDIARWIAGDVVEVRATGESGVTASGARHASAEATLAHAGGAISTVTARWGEPGIPFRTGVRVVGATAEVANDAAGDPVAGAGAGTAESPYVAQLRELSAAILGGPEPRVNLADGIRAVELAEAVTAAIATGEAVRLS